MTTTAPPHLYSSAFEAALAGASDTGSPCYSLELHLSRPFVLTNSAYCWGHYAAYAARGPRPQTYRTAKGDELAALFCDFLFEQQPEVMPDFKKESMALRAYYESAAPVSIALNAVFDSARCLHRIQGKTFQYVGFDRCVHAASAWDNDGNEYCVFFDEQLVLTQVSELGSRLRRPPQVWPTAGTS